MYNILQVRLGPFSLSSVYTLYAKWFLVQHTYKEFHLNHLSPSLPSPVLGSALYIQPKVHLRWTSKSSIDSSRHKLNLMSDRGRSGDNGAS